MNTNLKYNYKYKDENREFKSINEQFDKTVMIRENVQVWSRRMTITVNMEGSEWWWDYRNLPIWIQNLLTHSLPHPRLGAAM